MATISLARSALIDSGISVIVDLPHAADLPARPQLCSLMRADTHEPVTGVVGMSMHFDLDPARGNYELWAVAEQFVDDDGDPLAIGTKLIPSFHSEYFRGTLRTALFRYRVTGFTTGPRFDRSAVWHRDVGDSVAVPTNPSGDLTTFDVLFRDHTGERVAAHRFEIRDGFVTFLVGSARQVASFNMEHVTKIVSVPELKPLVVNPEQLRALRSAVLWDADRTSASPAPSEYREHLLDVLVNVLGMMPPQYAAPAGQSDSHEDDSDADASNKRTRDAVRQFDDLVQAV